MRPGMGGEPFYCFKFRTMREDTGPIQDELEALNEQRARCSRSTTTPG